MSEKIAVADSVEQPDRELTKRRLVGRNYLQQNLPALSITGVLIILVIIFSTTTSTFLLPGNLMNILEQVTSTLVVGVAMTFVITTSGTDLSVGSTLALISALSAMTLQATGSVLLTVVAMLALGAVIGVVNGWFIAYQGMPSFIVTLGTLSVFQGIALMLTQGYSIPVSTNFSSFLMMGQGLIGGFPVPALIAIVVALLGWVLLTRTKYGQYVIGIGSNEEAVRRAGVNTRLIKLSVYVLVGIMAALAAMIVTARLGSGSANQGDGFELQVIAAVVLGGTDLFGGKGTMLGTVIGTLVIGVIGNGLILLHLSPFSVEIVQGALLVVAIFANHRVLSHFARTERK
ncbi:MAG TPA: ABC transporter permease [Ktedonobacteraceae bacterium]|nr:ABC transporter permease [Ktedonobacteraceae bacterium]